MTRLRGQQLLDFIAEKRPDPERFRVARMLLFAIWGPFHFARLVHADPHPGNFLVMADGRLGVLDFGATKLLSEQFADVYRSFLEENAAGRAHPDVGPMLKRAGFRFLMDDEEDGFAFCQKMADIVQRPILQETFDFGADALITDVRRVFRAEPSLAIRIKPPPEALMFYRSAVGLVQDLRLLKARGPFRAALAEVKERGRA